MDNNVEVWTVITAIGTVAAAFVGIVGIWVNYYEKHRRLIINVNMFPKPTVYLCNSAASTILITKIRCYAGNSLVDAKPFIGDEELRIAPYTTYSCSLDMDELRCSVSPFIECKICKDSDTIKLELFDNYRRRYKVNTGLTVDALMRT